MRLRVRLMVLGGLCAGNFGLLLVAAALMLLGADLVASLETNGHIVTRSVADWCQAADPAGLVWLSVWSDQHLPDTVQTALQWLLGVYAWVYPGLIGVLLLFFFGPRRD
jgi:hypothetical protein